MILRPDADKSRPLWIILKRKADIEIQIKRMELAEKKSR